MVEGSEEGVSKLCDVRTRTVCVATSHCQHSAQRDRSSRNLRFCRLLKTEKTLNTCVSKTAPWGHGRNMNYREKQQTGRTIGGSLRARMDMNMIWNGIQARRILAWMFRTGEKNQPWITPGLLSKTI